MKRRKPKFWYCELFKMNFWSFYGFDKDEFESFLRDYDENFSVKDKVAGNTALVSDEKGTRICIWVKKQKRLNMLATLAHESVHAANYTLDIIGVHADFSNDETQAYLTEAIFVNCII